MHSWSVACTPLCDRVELEFPFGQEMETASKTRNSENTFLNMVLYVDNQGGEALEDLNCTG